MVLSVQDLDHTVLVGSVAHKSQRLHEELDLG